MPIAEPTPALEVDFVEELRLRCWARENYCPLEDRKASWHPVVHDEMRRRDADVTAEDVIVNDVLSPAEMESVATQDEPAGPVADTIADVEEPVFEDEEVVSESAGGDLQLAIGPIVPLAPELPGLHGPHEIRPPHIRIGAPVESAEMHYT